MKGFGGILPLELSDLSMGVYPLSSVELSFPKEPKGESFSGFLSSVCSFFFGNTCYQIGSFNRYQCCAATLYKKERKEKAYNNYTVAGNR